MPAPPLQGRDSLVGVKPLPNPLSKTHPPQFRGVELCSGAGSPFRLTISRLPGTEWHGRVAEGVAGELPHVHDAGLPAAGHQQVVGGDGEGVQGGVRRLEGGLRLGEREEEVLWEAILLHLRLTRPWREDGIGGWVGEKE